MANYPALPYTDIDVVAQTPTAQAPWSVVTLPDGAGVYQLLGVTIVRTAGALAANVTPLLGQAAAPAPLDVVDGSPVLLPVAAAFWFPIAARPFSAATNQIALAIVPNVYGDTYQFRVRVLRIQ